MRQRVSDFFRGPYISERVKQIPDMQESGGVIIFDELAIEDRYEEFHRRMRISDYHAGLRAGWQVGWQAISIAYGRPRTRSIDNAKTFVLGEGIRLGVITQEEGKRLLEMNHDPKKKGSVADVG